jgi:hypothetical protein
MSAATLVRRTSALLERRLPRRSVLVRAAVVASAATVAPIRYLTRPVSAQTVIGCGSCPARSLCCGGYTAFCCQLPGGDNYGCPDYAFVGGWWQCKYGGEGLCGNTNVRYYLDCNRKHSAACPGGCHCAQNRCSLRKTCCVTFRYGQCNTQIGGPTTPIACRLVTCLPPCRIDCLNCNCSSATDQYTCSHEAGCL